MIGLAAGNSHISTIIGHGLVCSIHGNMAIPEPLVLKHKIKHKIIINMHDFKSTYVTGSVVFCVYYLLIEPLYVYSRASI